MYINPHCKSGNVKLALLMLMLEELSVLVTRRPMDTRHSVADISIRPSPEQSVICLCWSPSRAHWRRAGALGGLSGAALHGKVSQRGAEVTAGISLVHASRLENATLCK